MSTAHWGGDQPGPVGGRLAGQGDPLALGDALLVQHRPGPADVRLQRRPLLLVLLPVVGPLLLLFLLFGLLLLLLLLLLFGLLGGASCCWDVGGQPRQRSRD